ncbi:hypothetical protein HUU05_04650 [candidate division KSB1 bacterium]|nr:hypothetical protein [candidate division KSB1 bacterium]
MMPRLKPLAEITRAAMQVLYKEIGPVNTIRFLNQFTTGHGNYTAEREQLVGDLSLDEIVSEIKQAREK